MKVIARVLPPLVPAVVAIAGTEFVVRADWVPAFLVATPSSIVGALFVGSGTLWQSCFETALGATAGFLLSAVVGIAVALALSSAGWVRRAFYPYALFLQTVPIIAIAPLLAIWIGLDLKTVVVSSFIVSVFPVIAGTLTGMLSTEPALRDMFKLYRASALATLFKLRLPAALPAILTGLRVAAGLSVIGAIVGEFITGAGIGGDIQKSIRRQDTPRQYALLLLSALLGLVLFSVVNTLSYFLLRRWHASEQPRE